MDFLTLSQLNLLVADRIRRAFPETYWLMAETSDVRINHSSGHCYLEFVERNELNGNNIAKARAYIWRNVFHVLKPYFEEATGREFGSGIKVLVRVGIDFHELYGYGLTVYDIDPAYTLGDIQRRRLEVIRQLDEEGVLNLNKELNLVANPQRIAVITSPTAAGYEDFMDHLQNNKSGFVFYPKLFPSIMQGEGTEKSVIRALDTIYLHKDNFDVVVIIRGGGASSDLSSFDSYMLAVNCAQFPLPIITGIGHERDDSVLDLVAYQRVKTPTAAADFLIGCMDRSAGELQSTGNLIASLVAGKLEREAGNIRELFYLLPVRAMSTIEKQSGAIAQLQSRILHACKLLIRTKHSEIREVESLIKLSSPQYILSKGYSIVRKNGKIVRSVTLLNRGDEIRIQLSDGEIGGKVEIIEN